MLGPTWCLTGVRGGEQLGRVYGGEEPGGEGEGVVGGAVPGGEQGHGQVEGQEEGGRDQEEPGRPHRQVCQGGGQQPLEWPGQAHLGAGGGVKYMARISHLGTPNSRYQRRQYVYNCSMTLYQ